MGQNGQQVVYDPYTGRYVYQPVQARGSFQDFASGRQTQSNMPRLYCRFVDDPDKVMPAEVPTTGDPSCFIKEDYTMVYLKAVGSDGKIITVPYAPVKQETPEDASNKRMEQFQDAVFSKLTQLETMINLLPDKVKPSSSPRPNDQKRNDGGNRNG